MSEFFTEPVVENYYKAKAATEAQYRLQEKLVLEPEIERLQSAAQHLAGLLMSRDTELVEPDPKGPVKIGERVSVINMELVPSHERPRFSGKAPLGRVAAETPGWIISKSKTTAQSRAVVLLEDGSLVLTHDPLVSSRQAVTLGALDLSRKVTSDNLSLLVRFDTLSDRERELLAPDIDVSLLSAHELEERDNLIGVQKLKAVLESPDNESYRPHPSFATPRGYTETYGSIPAMVTDGMIEPHTKAAYVAANLEHVGKDMRTVYAQLHA